MAETKDDIDVVSTSGGNSKLLMIIIAVLVLAIAGLSAMFLMRGDSNDVATDENTVTETVKTKAAPIYFSVEAPFVINFSQQSNGAVRYLQVKLKVMARDQAVIDTFQLNLPAIQHEILLLLFEQDYNDLSTNGTKVLQEKVLAKINDVLKSQLGKDQMEAVYFTSFLMH